MAKWIEKGESLVINLNMAAMQYETLGYAHRKELKLQCSACRHLTMVDSNIYYGFCPHCGAEMETNYDR